MTGQPKTIVLTGASDGIGAQAAKQLANSDHRLVLVGRNAEKTKAVAKEVGSSRYHVADFTKLDEVRRLASELLISYDHIDVLANNAGGTFKGPDFTADGFEKTFQVNHLSPVLLTYLLIDRLSADRALVVNTASIAARLFGDLDLNDLNSVQKYKPNRAYGNAKLANILFTRALSEKYHTRGLTAIAFHPGNVASNFAADTNSNLRWLYHTVLKMFLISAEAGGANLRNYIDPENRQKWVSGTFYNEKGKPLRTNKDAYDDAIVAEHWQKTAEMLGISW